MAEARKTPPPADSPGLRSEASSPLVHAASIKFLTPLQQQQRRGAGGTTHRSVADSSATAADGIAPPAVAGEGSDAHVAAAAIQLREELGAAHDDDRGHDAAVGRQRQVIERTIERMKSMRSFRSQEQSAIHRTVTTLTAELDAVRERLSEANQARYSAEDRAHQVTVACGALEHELASLRRDLQHAEDRITSLVTERDRLAHTLMRPKPQAAAPSALATASSDHHAVQRAFQTARSAFAWAEERCRAALDAQQSAVRDGLCFALSESPPIPAAPLHVSPAPLVNHRMLATPDDDVVILGVLEAARREAIQRQQLSERSVLRSAFLTPWTDVGSPPLCPRAHRKPSSTTSSRLRSSEHPPWYPPGPPTAVFHGVRSASVPSSTSTHRSTSELSPPRRGGSPSATTRQSVTPTRASPPHGMSQTPERQLTLTLQNMQRLLDSVSKWQASGGSRGGNAVP